MCDCAILKKCAMKQIYEYQNILCIIYLFLMNDVRKEFDVINLETIKWPLLKYLNYNIKKNSERRLIDSLSL